MFYEVAFIILAPLIIAVAVEAKVPYMKIAISAVAATTTAHSLFPPQPGPVALVDSYGADIGMVYILGLVVAIPTIAITGWVLPKFLGNLDYPVPTLLRAENPVPEEERPSFGISMFVPLIPAILMIAATIFNIWLVEGTTLHTVVNFLGSSVVSVSIAMLAAFSFFAIRPKRGIDWAKDNFEGAVKSIAMVVLIIGAGGALKQVIIDTGIGDYRADPPCHLSRRGVCDYRSWHYFRRLDGSFRCACWREPSTIGPGHRCGFQYLDSR